MLREVGKSLGIDFKKRPDKQPNTLKAHTLMQYAKEFEDGRYQNEVAEQVFTAFFTDGTFLDSDALVNCAVRAGLNEAEVKAFINDEKRVLETYEAAKDWSQKGVSSVPCVFMNGQQVFSGAQDTETFVKAIQKVADKYPLQSPSSL